jgi:hypothetical protein
MASEKRPGPVADSPLRADGKTTAAQQIGVSEQRCGAVLLTRYLEHDGRALLLYRHAGEQLG